MIRKYRYRHDIPAIEGYVQAHVMELADGFLVEYLKVPGKWSK